MRLRAGPVIPFNLIATPIAISKPTNKHTTQTCSTMDVFDNHDILKCQLTRDGMNTAEHAVNMCTKLQIFESLRGENRSNWFYHIHVRICSINTDAVTHTGQTKNSKEYLCDSVKLRHACNVCNQSRQQDALNQSRKQKWSLNQEKDPN